MRISIDATGLGAPKTGTVVYLTEILLRWSDDKKIEHDFIIFTNRNAFRHFKDLGLDDRFSFQLAPTIRWLRLLWQQFVLPWFLYKLRVDVHWGTGFVLPLLSFKRMVLTIHDLSIILFPDVHEKVKRYYFPFMIKRSIARARAVLAVSESTKADINRLIPYDENKVWVTPLAARSVIAENSEKVLKSKRDYLLFVGTVEPRKNLYRLLQAWQSIDLRIRLENQLLIVGAKGWLVDDLVSRLRNNIDAVHFLGHVEDSALFELLIRAKVFVYPSIYEGFGLPVIEAMSIGTPVLTSDIGATKELAEGAAVLVDPFDYKDIANGIEALLTDAALRLRLGCLGRERAACFSWEVTASKTLKIIERSARNV